VIPRDHAEELKNLTSALAADGWEEIDLGLQAQEIPGILDGISFRLLSSPDRQILLTANWRETGASTNIAHLHPADPRTALWHAEAVNMPVNILITAARAAQAQQRGSGPVARLRAAGWLRQSTVETGGGIRALTFLDPDGGRWASAQYAFHRARLVRGPWLIARDEIETPGARRAYAHTDSTAPGSVIAALALTRAEPSA
jgi:hypothetical protein